MSGSRKEYEMLFQLNAQLGGSYNSTFSKAQAEIVSMQNQIQSLSKTQGDISAYEKQQSALEATRQKMVTLQQQYDNIQKEIAETKGYSSALENRLLAKQQQIDKTSASMDRQTQNLQRLGESLGKAGVDTSNLTSESSRLETEIESLRKKQEEVADGAQHMGASGIQAIMAYQQAIVASGIQDTLKSIFDELQACKDASVQFESSLTGVDKTTNLTKSELAEMSDAVKELSTDIPVTTDEMLGIGEVAGQLGIAKENLLDFSETMSMLSTATTMAADEGATTLAQFANITQMEQDLYDELASSIVALGNTYATTEPKIAEMAQGIAASGSLAGMSEADMLGLSAAVSSLGIETQAGATSVSKLISELMTAVETGEGLEEFAHVANMTADEFAEAWGNDAAGALESFVTGLSDTERLGQSAIVTLNDLGITETRMQRTILSLSTSGDLLSRTIATANQAWDENIALSQEAAKRYATTASQQVLMENSLNNLRIAIGDNYTPALRELYRVGNDMFSMMTRFVEANPGLVKGLTATVGVIALVTGGLAAYTVGAKVAAAATSLLTSTIPGVNIIMGVTAGIAALTGVIVGLSDATNDEAAAVRKMTESSRAEYAQLQDLKDEYATACDMYGETSNQALYLAWQIDELNTSFENNKQSLSEYLDECDAVNESMTKMLDSNRNSFEEIGSSEGTTLALVARLKELAVQTDQTVETQEEMKAIIAELNNVVPDLALSYEDVVGGVTDYASAIEATVKAKAAAERYESAQSGMVDAYNSQIEAQSQLKDLTEQQASAKERLDVAEQKYLEYLNMVSKYDTTGYSSMGAIFSSEYKEYEAAQEAYDSYTDQIQETQGVLDQATSDYEEYKDALVGYVEETENATSTSQELNNSINDVMTQVDELSGAYELAYTAAYESVTGQYSLWDKTAEVVATSSETISTAMDSQITYWQDYNSNLQSLTERSQDIEGLSEMIASFADGSSDSVNAIAGMASASDEDLASMVEDWKLLQAEQENVSKSIAELHTNFTQKMDELTKELEADIKEMDLSKEAAASGRNTIQGYINGSESMLPQVEAAYTRIAQRAKDAIDVALGIHSPSREMAWRAEMTWAGYINQTRAMEPEVEKAMAEAANMGVDAADMQLTAFAPELLSVISAHGTNAVEAQSVRSVAAAPIQVTIHVDGDATPETVETLNMYGEEFAERVRSIIEDNSIDAERRSY